MRVLMLWLITEDGKWRFRAPRIKDVRDWREWAWKEGRGGKLRRDLEGFAPQLTDQANC
jgi:hypothetical protein